MRNCQFYQLPGTHSFRIRSFPDPKCYFSRIRILRIHFRIPTVCLCRIWRSFNNYDACLCVPGSCCRESPTRRLTRSSRRESFRASWSSCAPPAMPCFRQGLSFSSHSRTGLWIRIRMQKGKNDPKNIEKSEEFSWFKTGFRIRIRINFSCWIWIRIQIADPDPGGQKWPTKIEKSTEFSCVEVLDFLFWGLKASPVDWASFVEA